MWDIIVVFLIIAVVCFVGLIYVLKRKTPIGYEDEEGFHLDKDYEKEFKNK